MSFYIQTAKSNNQFYTNTAVNDVVLRVSNSNQKIHIGTVPSQPAPLIIDDSTINIKGDTIIDGNIILSNTLALSGLSLYPAPDGDSNSSILSSADAWVISKTPSNVVYSGNDFNVGIGTSNPESILHVVGDMMLEEGSKLISGNAFICADSSNLGIGLSNPLETLHVNGNILSLGTITPSDAILKKDIQRIENALSSLVDITGYTFRYVDNSNKKHSGFIAQQVEQVLPHVVGTTSIGFKTITYAEILPYVTEAIKEIFQEISVLKTKIESLEKSNGTSQM